MLEMDESKKIDSQTHEDVLDLVRAEMACWPDGRAGAPERLASVIESRMGYETSKEFCLPEISYNLHYHEMPTRDGRYEVYDRNVSEHMTSPAFIGGAVNKCYAKVFAAAPDLAEALNTILGEISKMSESEKSHISQEVWDDAKAALEKAGVDL